MSKNKKNQEDKTTSEDKIIRDLMNTKNNQMGALKKILADLDTKTTKRK